MTETERTAIKLQIWEAIMRRTIRSQPVGNNGYAPNGPLQGQFVLGGAQQYATECPAVQPLDAAKAVQGVFDALYPKPAKKKNR